MSSISSALISASLVFHLSPLRQIVKIEIEKLKLKKKKKKKKKKKEEVRMRESACGKRKEGGRREYKGVGRGKMVRERNRSGGHLCGTHF